MQNVRACHSFLIGSGGMPADSLAAYLRQLNSRIDDDAYEPEFDEKDEKKDRELRYDD